jgi:hypothetical protein
VDPTIARGIPRPRPHPPCSGDIAVHTRAQRVGELALVPHRHGTRQADRGRGRRPCRPEGPQVVVGQLRVSRHGVQEGDVLRRQRRRRPATATAASCTTTRRATATLVEALRPGSTVDDGGGARRLGPAA